MRRGLVWPSATRLATITLTAAMTAMLARQSITADDASAAPTRMSAPSPAIRTTTATYASDVPVSTGAWDRGDTTPAIITSPASRSARPADPRGVATTSSADSDDEPVASARSMAPTTTRPAAPSVMRRPRDSEKRERQHHDRDAEREDTKIAARDDDDGARARDKEQRDGAWRDLTDADPQRRCRRRRSEHAEKERRAVSADCAPEEVMADTGDAGGRRRGESARDADERRDERVRAPDSIDRSDDRGSGEQHELRDEQWQVGAIHRGASSAGRTSAGTRSVIERGTTPIARLRRRSGRMIAVSRHRRSPACASGGPWNARRNVRAAQIADAMITIATTAAAVGKRSYAPARTR